MTDLEVSPVALPPPNDATRTLQPDDVRVAARLSFETLQPVRDDDWTRPAGDLEWDCRRTLEHLVEAHDVYSLNLATPSGERIPSTSNRYPSLSNGELLTIMRRRAGIMAAVASAAAPTDRGYHGSGRPDPTGYIAMACVETIIHTDDIARGLGLTYQPPSALCQRLIARLFPWAPTDIDPWSTLRWATGRQELPGHGRTPPNWYWHSSPIAEWDGTVKTRDSRPTG